MRIKVYEGRHRLRGVNKKSAHKMVLSGWWEFRGQNLEIHRLKERRQMTVTYERPADNAPLPPAELPGLTFWLKGRKVRNPFNVITTPVSSGAGSEHDSLIASCSGHLDSRVSLNAHQTADSARVHD